MATYLFYRYDKETRLHNLKKIETTCTTRNKTIQQVRKQNKNEYNTYQCIMTVLIRNYSQTCS